MTNPEEGDHLWFSLSGHGVDEESKHQDEICGLPLHPNVYNFGNGIYHCHSNTCSYIALKVLWYTESITVSNISFK